MCDTFVVRQNNRVLFGKNSDREPGEPQLVVRMPPVSGDSRKKLAATYIAIDQTQNRHGVLLSKPSWIWGAEMGANDRGVVIGNEAVFTRVMEKTDGLIGMDLLRLGLERGDNATHALHVITSLLETYGQGGVCGFRDKKFRYDNSFIIADAENAWVLETAGRHWAAKKVSDFAAISNCLTIGTGYDMASAGIEDFARSKGCFKGKGPLDFQAAFEAPLMPFFARSRKRIETAQCAIRVIPETGVEAALPGAMAVLRTHQDPAGTPASGSNADICMHAAGPVRRSQTCGSMISLLEKGRSLHLLTGTSAPCLSVFKPAAVSGDAPFYVLSPDGQTVDGSLWRRFEPVHRHALFSAGTREMLRKSGGIAETDMVRELEKYYGGPASSDHLLHASENAVREWSEKQIEAFSGKPFEYPLSYYGWFWKRMNRMDGF